MEADSRKDLLKNDNRQDSLQEESRDRIIVRTSVIGIAANVLLAAFKAVIGLLTGSIAITLDAVNNTSDAASSVITIIGTKLAGKAPDKKHPFGYGRIEYISAMIIAVIVLYAGITSLVESVKKILDPVKPDYSAASLAIIAAAVLVKIILGRYVKKTGERVNSGSLINSGQDATLDSIISASTLAAAAVYIFSGFMIEAWLGAVISIVIIKSGIDMLRETLSQILGESADPDLVKKIKKTILAYPEVSGAYDLILNNYGPDRHNASIHIEVPDTLSINELDDLTRRITVDVYENLDILLTAVGIYALDTKDTEAAEIREKIRSLAMEEEHVLQMHGFYLDKESRTIRLDLVISFDAADRIRTFNSVVDKLRAAFPEYTFKAALDGDYAEQ